MMETLRSWLTGIVIVTLLLSVLQALVPEGSLRQLFADCRLTVDFQQYVLMGSTVRSYLSWLKDRGELDAVFDDNRLLWRKT